MSPGGRPGGVASLSMATTSTPAAAAAAWSFGTTLAGSEKGNSSAISAMVFNDAPSTSMTFMTLCAESLTSAPR